MLTLLATVKARLRLDDSDVRDDTLLNNYIALISARFENDCNRSFSRGSYTDEFDGHETELRLKAFPVETVTAIKIKSNEADGFTDLTATTPYLLRRKFILSLRAELGRPVDLLQVTYTGGFVLPGATVGAGQTALPDDLQFAAVEQIAYLYQNKDRLGIVSLSGEGGSIAQFAKLDLLPTVTATLSKYERWMP